MQRSEKYLNVLTSWSYFWSGFCLGVVLSSSFLCGCERRDINQHVFQRTHKQGGDWSSWLRGFNFNAGKLLLSRSQLNNQLNRASCNHHERSRHRASLIRFDLQAATLASSGLEATEGGFITHWMSGWCTEAGGDYRAQPTWMALATIGKGCEGDVEISVAPQETMLPAFLLHLFKTHWIIFFLFENNIL